MPIWSATPIEEVPELQLRDWRVFESPEGDRHLVGYNITEREGRVSSPISEFDATRQRAVTHSGRVYQLKGPSGYDADADYVWKRWMRIQGHDDYVDVTVQVAEAIAAADGG
jgi:hypothetical protein